VSRLESLCEVTPCTLVATISVFRQKLLFFHPLSSYKPSDLVRIYLWFSFIELLISVIHYITLEQKCLMLNQSCLQSIRLSYYFSFIFENKIEIWELGQCPVYDHLCV
jgi:hypothetical protein